MIKTKTQKGFTLIELMVTVGIIGIVSAIAIPMYQDYTIRSQITEGITLADGARSIVTEYHSNHGVYPVSSSDAGYQGASGKYVSKVEIDNGNVVATLGGEVNSKISGKLVVLTPTVNSGASITLSQATGMLDKLFGINSAVAQTVPGWGCYSNVEQRYLPNTCESKVITLGSNNNGGTDTGTTPTNPDTGSGSGTDTGSGNTGNNPPPDQPPVTSTETQALSCNSFLGNNYQYTGGVTQERTVTTYPSTGVTTYSDWQTTSNTCTPAASTSTTETQSLSCNVFNSNTSKYTGSVTQQRTTTTDYTGAQSTTDWSTTSNTCSLSHYAANKFVWSADGNTLTVSTLFGTKTAKYIMQDPNSGLMFYQSGVSLGVNDISYNPATGVIIFNSNTSQAYFPDGTIKPLNP